jgi:hypothetical protein
VKQDEPISKAALADIRRERLRQDAQWGGEEHDDNHEYDAWVGFIDDQVAKARNDIETRSGAEGNVGEFEVRDRLVKIAALAIAGINSIDRKVADRL